MGWKKVWFFGGIWWAKEVEKTEVKEVKTRRKTTKEQEEQEEEQEEEEAIWLECFGEVVCFTVMMCDL